MFGWSMAELQIGRYSERQTRQVRSCNVTEKVSDSNYRQDARTSKASGFSSLTKVAMAG